MERGPALARAQVWTWLRCTRATPLTSTRLTTRWEKVGGGRREHPELRCASLSLAVLLRLFGMHSLFMCLQPACEPLLPVCYISSTRVCMHV